MLVRQSAVVYCEGSFGLPDGKTANGLVRHSERYEVLSVVDSTTAGLDAGLVLDGVPNGIPVVRTLSEAVVMAGTVPAHLIVGLAPSSGLLAGRDRAVVLDAMARGMGIVSGLHEFLADDPEFAAASVVHDVQLLDVRRPQRTRDLQAFSGRIAEVTCPRIAVLGTDCAIGKRTTATVLTDALTEAGHRTVLVGTGQTGLMQGARFGVAMDAIPAQFAVGELEAAIVAAFIEDRPDVIVVEGQSSLSHPAYTSSAAILRGARPDAVILQHAPARTARVDFPADPVPSPQQEIAMIHAYSTARVIGLTINHEGMTDAEVTAAIAHYERELGVPATDALTRPVEALVAMVRRAFPHLAAGRAVGVA